MAGDIILLQDKRIFQQRIIRFYATKQKSTKQRHKEILYAYSPGPH